MDTIRQPKLYLSAIALNDQAIVRLVKPPPTVAIATIQLNGSLEFENIVKTKAVGVASTKDSLLTAKLEQVRWINPQLAAAIATIRTPINGVSRSQITVPICPNATVTDDVLFEDSVDSTKKFYLPRYRVAERNQQVQVSLTPSTQGWSLTIHLEKYPSPSLQEQARNAQEIDHTVSVILQHRLVSGNANGGQKELVFEQPAIEAGGIRAVLQVTTLNERDLLYQVLTSADYGAVLTIRRTVKVAVPANISASIPTVAATDANLPKPQLQITGTETYEAGGKQWTRYLLSVSNWSAFPDELFAPAPDLPPCGLNKNAARTWIDIYAEGGVYLYGFCALSSAQNLNSLWFAVAKDQASPASVYITLKDRRLDRTYTSNSISTTESSGNTEVIVSSGSGTLRGTWLFSFDTGAEMSESADVWWEQQTETVRFMLPQGNAQITNIGVYDFDAVSLAQLQSLQYSTAAIDGSISNDPPIQLLPNTISDASSVLRRPPIVIDDEPYIPSRNQLVNGDVFAVLTNNRNYAKVQVLEYGYNLKLRWVTYRPANSEPLFREVTRVVDNKAERDPFVFPASLYPYIFSGITGATDKQFKPDLRQVNGHSYYQDPVERHLFYYLPDRFKLVRRPESPHYPMVSIRFSSVNGSAEEVQATIEYWASPFVDAARLASASTDLKKYITDSLAELVFQPLVADKPRLFLGLLQPDGSLTNQEYPEILVELRTGFRDSRTLSLESFQSVYDALFSEMTQLFKGQVRVDFPDGPSEIIPFDARIDDLVGECFDYTKEIDTTTGAVSVTLKNAIESPVKITHLGAALRYEQVQVPGTLSSLSMELPAELKPDATISFTVTPTVSQTNLTDVVFDLSGVKVLPDREAVWNAILRPDSPAHYQRSITVKTTKVVFGEQIAVISVDFKRGDSIDFNSDDLSAQLAAPRTVLAPISDLVLHKEDSGMYEYRVMLILKNGNKVQDPPNQWRTEISETLWITSDVLPTIPG